MTTTTITINITPTQILEHRRARKESGMVGCITGRPAPKMDFFGFGDVQIWNRDASGILNGDPGFNRKDPHCFCFDCRGDFDSEGTMDAELVNEGHPRARWTYESLVPVEARIPPMASEEPPSTLETSWLSNKSPPSLREPIAQQ